MRIFRSPIYLRPHLDSPLDSLEDYQAIAANRVGDQNRSITDEGSLWVFHTARTGLFLKPLFCLLLEFPNHKGQNITAENRQEDTGSYPQYQAADDGWLCGKFHAPITHLVATVCKRITLISFPDKPLGIITFPNITQSGLLAIRQRQRRVRSSGTPRLLRTRQALPRSSPWGMT